MDMQKNGLFLAELRKMKNLTQDELGDLIGVTNKTISRWENGNYLPPVEMLQILSKLYNVSLNELLSGERLNDSAYKESAEENISVALMKSAKEAKKRIIISFIVATITILGGTAIILMGTLISNMIWVRISSIVLSIIIVILGIGVCCVLTVDAGVYVCPNCGEKFVPSMKDFVFSVHTFTKRKLKCPNCGKKNYSKKRFG